MDAQWLISWSEFVRSDSCLPPTPGPVSSLKLLKEDGVTPLHGLSARVDYRGVTPLVFYSFCELYGRDRSPEICRFEVDIYKASGNSNK